MKKLLITIGILASQLLGHSQQFVNGRFTVEPEYVSWIGDSSEFYTSYNPELYNFWFPDNQWWGNVKYSTIGSNGIENNDTTYFPIITVNSNFWYDVISLKLDSPLEIGKRYKIKFDQKLNIDVPLTFETSYTSGQFGNEIYTFQPQGEYLYQWRPNEFEFIAQDSSNFINVYINLSLGVEYDYVQLGLDNFVLDEIIDINTHLEDNKVNPTLKYDVYTFDGKLISRQIIINELPSGAYILVSGNKVFKLIK